MALSRLLLIFSAASQTEINSMSLPYYLLHSFLLSLYQNISKDLYYVFAFIVHYSGFSGILSFSSSFSKSMRIGIVSEQINTVFEEGVFEMYSIYRQRKAMRLSGYDYASRGAYFFTTCTSQRLPFFQDEICKQMAEQVWQGLPQRFPSIRLDAFAVLPDHIHS